MTDTASSAARKLPAKREPETFVQTLERVARDPNISIERMQQLLDMKERMERREAEQAFNVAMNAAQAEIPQVARSKKADRYKYAPLEAVANAIDSIVHKHGFTLSFGTEKSELPQHYRITCRCSHIGGHTIDRYADIPSDLAGPKGVETKNATQAFGSTMSYGRRYLTLMIFNVKLKNEDDDGLAASSNLITPAMVDMLQREITQIGVNLPAFLKHMKIAKLEDLSNGRYPKAIEALALKRKQSNG